MADVKNVMDPITGETLVIPLTAKEIAQQELDVAAGKAQRDATATAEALNAKTLADGMTHALSLGFTQAQAEAMFP